MFEVRRYLTPTGKDVFDGWLTRRADPPPQAKVATRIDRLVAGNFGDCKPLLHRICGFEIDCGPRYWVYYAMIGKDYVLLLCGGDKRKQSPDIDRAAGHLRGYRERTKSS